MGAETFQQESTGETAAIAFRGGVAAAQYEAGHGGYTGTLAEKTDFIVIDVPEGMEPRAFAEKLIDDDDPRISSKWGPAGCVALGPGKWLFFGWASS